MPDTLRNGRYRVEMEIAADLVPARKRKYALQRIKTPNSRNNQHNADKILARNGKWRANFAPRNNFCAAKSRGVFIDGFWQGIDTRAERTLHLGRKNPKKIGLGNKKILSTCAVGRIFLSH